jgi:hypothetical protein
MEQAVLTIVVLILLEILVVVLMVMNPTSEMFAQVLSPRYKKCTNQFETVQFLKACLLSVSKTDFFFSDIDECSSGYPFDIGCSKVRCLNKPGTYECCAEGSIANGSQCIGTFKPPFSGQSRIPARASHSLALRCFLCASFAFQFHSRFW